jgi:hypothetical protein
VARLLSVALGAANCNSNWRRRLSPCCKTLSMPCSQGACQAP